MILVLGVWAFVRAFLVNSAAVSLENVALRHQRAVLQRSVGRPRLHRRDRLFWVAFSQVWAGWRACLVIVQPATILAWHRQGFQLYWRSGLGMTKVLIAPRAPWQKPFAERIIGSIRRECLDHVIVLNEGHLRRLLRRYFAYYNATRPHQALHNDSPYRREVQMPAGERIVAVPQVGGLHHRYQRAA